MFGKFMMTSKSDTDDTHCETDLSLKRRNEGPRKNKEMLLMLDSIEDWIGRARPLTFGRDGASAAKDRGEKTLAEILNQDDDSFGGKDVDLESLTDDGWINGIGEGRSDEANLSCYFRMSEGDDENDSWRSDGLVDLTPYQNKATVVGDAQSFSLQPSTSSVDEGEPGKVKTLFDLVFGDSGRDVASGLAIPAVRGGSLDIGVLHSADRETRMKCSIEFWYYLPTSVGAVAEVVLARRTMGSSADDLAKVAVASKRNDILWELLLRQSGELEFRTCGGSSLLSSQNYAGTSDDIESSDEGTERFDLAAFERWNHVCVVLSSNCRDPSDCSVSIVMKGAEVAFAETSMLPPGFAVNDLRDNMKLSLVMQKSHLLFGLGHGAGFRMTELRVWACERSAADTLSFLYEYLNVAEQKKKFKVKISSKNRKEAALEKGISLASPKGLLSIPRSFGTTPARGFRPTTKAGALATIALDETRGDDIGAPLCSDRPLDQPMNETTRFAPNGSKINGSEHQMRSTGRANKETEEGPTNDPSIEFGLLEGEDFLPDVAGIADGAASPTALGPASDMHDETEFPATLWDSAVPLSQQIRASAAAALIRGPPATRHYGGNRGGLPDLSGVDRLGVGGIAVCGAERTIIWRDNEDPPALTYPIGASGAVISDEMDGRGSKFLCCFLAKERRMVVFELRSRTVVVELQMTTKLNFWRFLPPEAAGNTLCFMLVTPVGGFHWNPLNESPRPCQIWKRGPELQGKKIVTYEEGGSNGLDEADIRSRVGLITATRPEGSRFLQAWIIPIEGDSTPQEISDDVMGACLCQLPDVDHGAFLPLLVTVHTNTDEIAVSVLSISEPTKGTLALGEEKVAQTIDLAEYGAIDLTPPALAMGSLPEAICVSLSNIVVVVLRRKGLVAAFELESDKGVLYLNLIALETVDHFVVDAVMRYSPDVGGAEIVMLLSDNENAKDGRVVSFCFRSVA